MIDDLYSDRVLRLAANLPRAGRLADPHGTAERTAKLCGSRIVVDVRVQDGRVLDYAHDVQACALGQAAAAILGAQAVGATTAEVAAARDSLRSMLKAGGGAADRPVRRSGRAGARQGFPGASRLHHAGLRGRRGGSHPSRAKGPGPGVKP